MAAAAFATTTAHAQPLPTLTDSLLTNNPALRALDLAYEAAAETRDAARELPDLELGAGLGVLPVETRLGPQRLRVGATQMLPWPGVLDAREALADARAAPIREEVAARALDLRYRLAEAYFALAAIAARTEVLGDARELYDVLEATALSRIEAGGGSSVDVYRVTLQREQVDERLAALAAQRAGLLGRANALLSRPPTSPIATTPLDQLAADTVALPPLPVLAEALPASHPLLRVYERRQAIAVATAALVDLDARPDFAVGLDYVLTGARDDADPMSNGRDAVIPRVGVRIPLSRKPYTARRRAEALRIEQIASERESARDRLLAEAAVAYAELASARATLTSLARQTDILEAALRVATGEYAEGRRDFEEVIGLSERLIRLRLGVVDARRRALTARAAIAQTLAL